MVEVTIIQKYLDEFHDGSLISIQHGEKSCILFLESAEIDISDISDDIELSERNTIKGKLHLEDVVSTMVDNIPIKAPLKMKYDYGCIFDFKILNNNIELQISWRNAPTKPKINDFSTINIRFRKIWWENIPDLYDPFW